MLTCAEQVQIQTYKIHSCKTPQTTCVQTIMIKNQLSSKDRLKKKMYRPIKGNSRMNARTHDPDHTN